MAPLKDSTVDSLGAILRVFLQYVLPIGLAVGTLGIGLVRRDRVFAGALLLTIPAVVAALAWRFLRPAPKDGIESSGADDFVAQVLVGIAYVAVVALTLLLRFGALDRILVLAIYGLAYAGAVVAMLLGPRKSTFAWAGGAVALLSLLYVFATTTTKAYYFGATDLMAFFPSIERLMATGDLDQALPPGRASYAHIPLYFLFAAGGSFVMDGDPLRALFHLFGVLYPVMGLALVAMLRRLEVPDRVAWIAFAMTLVSRPFLLEATYPTPRSLAVFLMVAVLVLACAISYEPAIANVPAVLALILLGIGLAFVHKVSGLMTAGPLLVIFALAAWFMPPIEARVRRVLLWSLGFIVVLHVTNSLFTTGFLREALQRIFDVSTAETDSSAPLLDWTWRDTGNFLVDNAGAGLLMLLVLAGGLVLLRRPDEFRMRNVGLALMAYGALQVALLSPFYASKFFTDTLSFSRLAPVAILFCALPAALALVGLGLSQRPWPVKPARLFAAGLFVVLLVVASLSTSIINQDLAVSRRPIQYTSSFSESELASVRFGEAFTGPVLVDRIVARYYTANPFTGTVYDRVYDQRAPPEWNSGYMLVRYPEYESGYTQMRINLGTDDEPRYVLTLSNENDEYARLIDGAERRDSVLYDSGDYAWYRYTSGA